MPRLFVAIAAMAIMASAPVSAEPWTPDRNQCNQQQSTLDIVDCLAGRTKIWDGRLNQAYKSLTAALFGQPQRIAALRTAEQAWIKFKDANCAYYGSQGGTIRQVAAAGCVLTMTQDRAIELQRELPP